MNAVSAKYEATASAHLTRRVWAEVTKTPCATSRQLAQRIGASYSQVNRALRLLKNAGYVQFDKGATAARTIVIPFIVIGDRHD